MITIGFLILIGIGSFLIGSFPTGFLVGKWFGGIDVRTEGSGNPGATNVGRLLGFRYFVLVMAVDLLKGLVPTLIAPWLLARVYGDSITGVGVITALGTIVGHNFSVFLRFRGGKGVATSLGAMCALDPIASGVAAGAFLFCLLITKYVSMSSILGGTAFVTAHFVFVSNPLSPKNWPFTLLLMVLYPMLIIRHRSNLQRIWAGTERKVLLRKKKPDGRVRIGLLGILVVLLSGLAVAGTVLTRRITEPTVATIGGARWIETCKFRTGHQRVGVVTFYDRGNRLAIGCPRYNYLLLYDVKSKDEVQLLREISLDGRPYAIKETPDGSILVLQRPVGDAHHLEEGYYQEIESDGQAIGDKVRVGWDPDDCALSTDGRFLYVLVSGNAEGEEGKPPPSLVVIDRLSPSGTPKISAQLFFENPDDDPETITLSSNGEFAAVTLYRSEAIVGIDLIDPNAPLVTGRVPLLNRTIPYLAGTLKGDEILMPVDSSRSTALIPQIANPNQRLLVTTGPEASTLEIVDAKNRLLIGNFPLRGPLNLGTIRPTDLDYSSDRQLLVVADRSGGVRLIKVQQDRTDQEADQVQSLASERSETETIR